MKQISGLTSLFIIALLFVPQIHAQDVSLKLSGGRSFFYLPNTNRLLKDWAFEEREVIEAYPNWTYLGGNVLELHSGLDFAAEIQIALTSRITVGIGAGYIYSERTEDETSLTLDTSVETWIEAKPIKISALPITISAYYFFPLSSSARLYMMGGIGTIWGKYIEREAWRLETDDDFMYPLLQRTSGRGTIFFAGGGFEYEFEPGIRVFFEGSGNMCQISDFQGENEQDETGVLYYLEEYIQEFEIWQAKNQIMAAEPSGENFKSVQKATVDLSGLKLRIGLTFRF